jgi:tight adherence protein B
MSAHDRWGDPRGAVTRAVRWISGARSDDDAGHAQLLEAVARSLRASAAPSVALAEGADAIAPSPLAAELARALGMVERGAPLSEALAVWIGPEPTAARQLAGAALALGSELGGAWASALDGAAAGLRDRAEVAREVRALTAQARSSAAVMVLSPIGFAAYAWTTDPRIAAFVFGHPLGWSCLGLGVALDAAGAAWMRVLTASVA